MSDQVQDTATATNDGGVAQVTDPAQGQVAPDVKPAAVEPAVEYKFDAPEGVDLNQEDLDKFTTIAKDAKLAPDVAKKFVDLAAAREVARAEAFAKQVESWGEAVKADKELGLPENLALARKAVETFGDDEMRDLLNSTGIGNHPVFVRAMLKVGRAISEDKIVAGRTGGNTPPRDHASILYGNTPTNS